MLPKQLPIPKLWKETVQMGEFVAYIWELFHTFETGLRHDPGEVMEVGNRLFEQGWRRMTDAEQKVNLPVYNVAIAFIRTLIGDETWTP